MSQNFNVRFEDKIMIMTIGVYVHADVGREIALEAEKAFVEGKCSSLIIDLTGCPLVNSPGIAYLLDIACRISQDFKGKLIFCGLDSLKFNIFTIAGVLALSMAVDKLQDALDEIRESRLD